MVGAVAHARGDDEVVGVAVAVLVPSAPGDEGTGGAAAPGAGRLDVRPRLADVGEVLRERAEVRALLLSLLTLLTPALLTGILLTGILRVRIPPALASLLLASLPLALALPVRVLRIPLPLLTEALLFLIRSALPVPGLLILILLPLVLALLILVLPVRVLRIPLPLLIEALLVPALALALLILVLLVLVRRSLLVLLVLLTLLGGVAVVGAGGTGDGGQHPGGQHERGQGRVQAFHVFHGSLLTVVREVPEERCSRRDRCSPAGSCAS
ncbi:hypothetical protein [Planomonospora venezuelensis]|uniref:hypothetical protein n=1 Tax=Planomonospora venezuelensis TaxID=1999 RepID=UPI003673327C